MYSAPNNPRILISVGELSADEHAAHLVKSLAQKIPNAQFKAMGGRKLREAGVETIVDSEHSASVMGFSEVLGALGRVLQAYRVMRDAINNWRPDVLVVLDYPDFHFRLIKYAKARGVRVFYFIPPQVWAWRTGRVEFLKNNVDAIASIFPFELDFLRQHGYTRATFVGHPLLDNECWSAVNDEQKRLLKSDLGFDPQKLLLAIFPGSRRSEIAHHLDPMVQAAHILRHSIPDLQCVINVAPSFDVSKIQSSLSNDIAIRVIKAPSESILRAADVGFLKSGTSNLQAALCGLPFVMFYRTSFLSAWIVKNLVKLSQYSIVNILKANTVSEFVQNNATSENAAGELKKLITDRAVRDKMINAFHQIRASLAAPADESIRGKTCYERTASLIAELLRANSIPQQRNID